MNMKKKIWGLIGGLALVAGIAIAGSGTITVLDSAGATKTYSIVTDGSGNFVGRTVICDQAAAASCATVTGNVLSTNAAQINGVAPLMGNGVSGTGALRVTVASDSAGQVTLAAGAATIGALAANQSTNEAQINGVAPLMGNGVSGTGAQRVTIASDSTGQIVLAAGAASIGSLAANQSVNIAQMNGVTTTMGNGASGTGVQRVTVASDSTGTSIVTQATGTNLHIVCDSGCGTAASAGYSNSVTFTTGTTAYAVADAVGASGAAAAVSFTTMGPASTEVMVTSAELEIDTTAPISGETSYTLYMYNVTPPSALNDSAAWTLPSGDRASFLGAVQLGTPAVPQPAATTLYVRQDNINTQIKLGATPTIFAYLVSNGAFTPTARVYKITLHTAAL